jgi:type I restriction enzyme R subunit
VHRSIFGKYTSILSYFDALMVGLTATPREDDDRSTYELFERESGEPNFEYLLDEAVSDGYLVDKQVLSRTTDILKNGIKYDKLSDEEKKQMESIWKYEKAKLNIPDDELYKRNIEHDELFSYIFNQNTVDKVIIDVTGPMMQVIEFPARVIHRAYTYFYDISHIYTDNQQLRNENKQMMILNFLKPYLNF